MCIYPEHHSFTGCSTLLFVNNFSGQNTLNKNESGTDRRYWKCQQVFIGGRIGYVLIFYATQCINTRYCIKMHIAFHLPTGLNAWKGRDVETEEFVFIKKWIFSVHKIKQKCTISCEKIAKPLKCNHTIKMILKDFHARATSLINKVKHKNLVRYVGVNSDLNEHFLTITIVQEFVEGDSIRSICENGQLLNVPAIGKEMLESIVYLQNWSSGLTHGYLKSESIFLDHTGACRVADYGLIPYLKYLRNDHEMHKESDLTALGNLIGQLSSMMIKSSNNFVAKCCSGRILNISGLLSHPFVASVYQNKRPSSSGLSMDSFDIAPEKLGEGQFGTVFKAIHHGDRKSYAIKTIIMPESKNICEKFSREAELMSSIVHKNVVRYITSWKQMVNLPAFRNRYNITLYDNEEDEESGSSST